MNSEELEQSLRTEFEDYLKNVVADMQQEVAQFQEKIEAEFEKHRSQLDSAFQEFSTKFAAGKEIDKGFKESVVEHLRLARDEGAKMTAEAFAKAEEMEKEMAFEQEQQQPAPAAPTPTEVGLGILRSAINEISKQTSQATVLQTLVEHAARFAPRGAFFIVKNEQFVGWRVFGQDADVDDEAVRDISFAVASASVLGESVRSLSAVESSFGTYDDNSTFLEPLSFGEPSRMIAIPLVARGRGVAVLYADTLTESKNINVDALETLVCVAGLTVEVLASAPSARPVAEAQTVYAEEAEYAPAPGEETESTDYAKEFDESEFKAPDEYPAEAETKGFDTKDFQTVEDYQPSEEFAGADVSTAFEEDVFSATPSDFETSPQEFIVDDSSIKEIEVESFQPAEVVDEKESVAEEFQFGKDQSAETEEISAEEFSELGYSETDDAQIPKFDASTLVTDDDFSPDDEIFAQSGKEDFELPKSENGKTDSFVPAPVAETAAESAAVKPARSRLSDRNVDLPIEVSEDERRLHNDARRFARLLVSEIKLYNEQKVKEGRESEDLYDRLREAIDRSREMYDKRVQPPVAAKFDYFHYEIVSSLAEGEENRLGGGYPGSAI